jgi:hypothetical protein
VKTSIYVLSYRVEIVRGGDDKMAAANMPAGGECVELTREEVGLFRETTVVFPED